jgi:hypothetical protein
VLLFALEVHEAVTYCQEPFSWYHFELVCGFHYKLVAYPLGHINLMIFHVHCAFNALAMSHHGFINFLSK